MRTFLQWLDDMIFCHQWSALCTYIWRTQIEEDVVHGYLCALDDQPGAVFVGDE